MAQLGDALRLLNIMGREHSCLPEALSALGFDSQLFETEPVKAKKQPLVITDNADIDDDKPEPVTQTKYPGFELVVLTQYQTKDVKKQPIQQQIKNFEPLKLTQVGFIDPEPPTPLWTVNQIKNTLLKYLSVSGNSNKLDVLSLVNKMAARQLIKQLPYQQVNRLPADIWLYFDMSNECILHREDLVELYPILFNQLGHSSINQIVELFDGDTKTAQWSIRHKLGSEVIEQRGALPLPPTGVECIIVSSVLQLNKKHWQQLISQLKQQQSTCLILPLTTKLATSSRFLSPQKSTGEALSIVLAALSLTPRWISLAMIRDLRLTLTDALPELEQQVVNQPGFNWSWPDQIGEWDSVSQKHRDKFKTFPSAMQLSAIEVIKRHIPKPLTTITQEHQLLAYTCSTDWASTTEGTQAKEEIIEHFQEYQSRILNNVGTDFESQLADLQWLLAKALRFEGCIGPEFSEVTRCFTLANFLWQQQVGSNELLTELDPALAAEFKQQHPTDYVSGSINYYQNQLKQHHQSHSHSQSETPNDGVKDGVKVLNLIDSTNLFMKSANALVVPSAEQSLTVHTAAESFTLKTLNSNSFYWAKTLSITSGGVVATTEYIKVSWPNDQAKAEQPRDYNGAIIEVLDHAPTWLKEYKPKLDELGLFTEITLKDCSFVLRYIPPGSFLMGSPEDEPERDGSDETQHTVTLTQGYWLAETTVTQNLWQQVMGDNPSGFKPQKDELLPVDSVSYDDCLKFLAKLNGQLSGLELTLPTEAQWEYACRGGTTTPFYTGSQLSTEQANYNGKNPYHNGAKGEYRKETVAVESFSHNDWGLYQMHGNLWEWCVDGLRDYSSHPQVDPQGKIGDDRFVLRGGGWNDSARYCRSALRNSFQRDFRYDFIGLRVAQVELKQENSEGGAAAVPSRGGARGASAKPSERAATSKFSKFYNKLKGNK